jgi:integrase
VHFDRVTFEDLSEDFLQDYRLNLRKSQERAEASLKHLKRHFGDFRVPDITTPEIQTYIENRLEDGAANGTINRELSALKRILNLGARQYPPKVNRVPFIPMLKEKNVRKGFFKHQEYLALLKALPSYLRPVVIFAYKTGWRKSEILGLTWNQVDSEEGAVRLEADETKNLKARTVYMDKELLKLMKIQRLRKGKDCNYVFHNKGRQIKDFRKSWKTACNNASVSGRLLHDLRRTAVRNMVRSGVPERVAMMISGHKTRSVFDRYNIVSKDDLKEAAAKQEAYLNQVGS